MYEPAQMEPARERRRYGALVVSVLAALLLLLAQALLLFGPGLARGDERSADVRGAPPIADEAPSGELPPGDEAPAPADSDEAPRPLGVAWLDEAYARLERGDRSGARAAFQAAARAGERQRASVELGYLDAEEGRDAQARRYFAAAAEGPDPDLAAAARGELSAAPEEEAAAGPRRWTELYAEAFGWNRLSGEEPGGNLAPSTRLRLLVQPWRALDLHLFLGAHLSRDFGWTTAPGGVPPTYAEGALLAGGVLLRAWDQRLAFVAQAGPTSRLQGSAEERRVRLDARLGASLYLESPGCRPARGRGLEVVWRPCADAWAEALLARRGVLDLGALGRARAGGTVLLTGPIAWGPVVELRAAGDREGALYGEFVEGGAGLRARLLGRLPIDLLATFVTGRRLGTVEEGAGSPEYRDLRLQLATYLELR